MTNMSTVDESRHAVDDRAEALERAVQHHGLANQAKDAVPPSASVVLRTAKMFEEYLLTGEVPDKAR